MPFDSSPPALRVSNLGKRFGRPVVNDLNLCIAPGEFYGLLGANGAGKTTTLRMIAGLLGPDAGRVEVFGVDMRANPRAAKQLMAWLPDEPMLYDRLTPLEYLEFVAGLWAIPAPRARSRARELLELLELWAHRDERCGAFSRGMKQKTALAGALLHEPKLLLLDEPLTGLDVSMSRQVKDLLRDYVRAGNAVILTTHILDVAERLVGRIGIMKQGQLLAEGTLDELRASLGSSATSLEDVFLGLVS